jgi:hypothetical protein
MQEIEMPDGEIVEFPDDASDSTITSAVKNYWEFVKGNAKDLLDTAEAAASIATGTVAEVAGGLTGAVTGAVTRDSDAAEAVRAGVTESLTHTPTREGSQQQLQAVGEVLAPAGEVITRAEDVLGDKGVQYATGLADALGLEGESRDQLIAIGGTLGATSVTALLEASALRGFTMTPPKSSQVNMFVNAFEKDADNATLAMQKHSQNVDRDTIWKEHGMFLDGDGFWKAEVSDETAALTEFFRNEQTGTFNVDAVVSHPYFSEMFKHIPVEERAMVTGTADLPEGVLGSIHPITDEIKINVKEAGTDQLTTLLHEMQHYIQKREGFAPGASSAGIEISAINDIELRSQIAEAADEAMQASAKTASEYFKRNDILPNRTPDEIIEQWFQDDPEIFSFYTDQVVHDMYLRTAGEVEARLVEARRTMTEAERRATPPWETLKGMGIDEDDILWEDWQNRALRTSEKITGVLGDV